LTAAVLTLAVLGVSAVAHADDEGDAYDVD
jgi:hypothetical protein